MRTRRGGWHRLEATAHLRKEASWRLLSEKKNTHTHTHAHIGHNLHISCKLNDCVRSHMSIRYIIFFKI